MGTLTRLLLTGVGAVVVGVVLLGAIATIVAFVLGVVATAVTFALIAATIGAVVLASVSLLAHFLPSRDTAETPRPETTVSAPERPARDTESDDGTALRERYVAGEIDELEFERELERVLEESPASERETLLESR
ncbi:SHOCT domain-containing protein [Natronobiforma cellulositropha]|uniref:SHOCT domain-containing protein n=1 Tax=Natronobiforma cellulositropha TaxID=1679076 RepID=UPI0021D5A584|nr:SHOCT domain-containing protein [Natronobiforma cellulositropha]